MKVSQKTLDALKRNNKLKGLFAIALKRTVYTIDRWIRTNDIKQLTGAVILHIELIKEHTGFSSQEILESETSAND